MQPVTMQASARLEVARWDSAPSLQTQLNYLLPEHRKHSCCMTRTGSIAAAMHCTGINHDTFLNTVGAETHGLPHISRLSEPQRGFKAKRISFIY